MSYLLDPHVILWIAFVEGKISPKARKILLADDSEIFMSAVSFFEISIKNQLGKLDLKNHTPETLLEGFRRNFECRFLDLSFEEAVTFFKLERIRHRDPFDRMLIWQALQRGHTLLTNDEKIAVYQDTGLKVLW